MNIIKKYEDLPDGIKHCAEAGNVFFSIEYSRYAESTGAHMWYLFDENYLLPASVSEKATIKQALYMSEPLEISDRHGDGILTGFLNEASVILKKQGIAWIYTSAAAFFSVYPDESQRIPFGSHVIDLSLSEEEVLQNMHSKHRNSVRRAERNGVTVVAGGKELIDDYLQADADTWERSNRESYGDAFFERIVENLGDKSIIYVAYHDGKPQSGACYFYNKKMSYYMYGASITNPEPGAANLLQWKAIMDMKAKGVEKFSFVGCRINEDEDSKYHGIQRFKERFGGALQQGYMFKCILSNTKYNAFHMMYKIKNGVELSDAVDQEIHKWSDLNR